jgi:hypothetical protein
MMIAFFSCNWAKQKTKESVNKTGEVVGKAGSEFVNGVAKGVEKTFDSKLELSNSLTAQGLKTGKVLISSSDSASDNILTPYFIFDGSINQPVTIRVISETGQEYGRVKQQLTGKKGEAHYIDFIFDRRTNIDGRSKIIVE